MNDLYLRSSFVETQDELKSSVEHFPGIDQYFASGHLWGLSLNNAPVSTISDRPRNSGAATTDLPEYNGWKNYPTWTVHLWLQNDEGLYREACFIASEGPEALREWVETLMPVTGMAGGLTGWALSLVDWDAVTEALAEGQS